MYIDAIDDMDVWSDFATKECSWNGRNVKPLYMREQDASIVNAVFSWDDRMTATPAMSRPSQITREERREDGVLKEREETTKWGIGPEILRYEKSVTNRYEFPNKESKESSSENRETDVHDHEYE